MTRLIKYVDLFLIVAFSTLYIFLSTRFTFWGDELFSVFYAKKGVIEFVKYYFHHPDPTHPIGYYFLLNLWQKIFNIGYANDTWFRVFSIVFHFVAVILIARKAFSQVNQRLWFIALCGVSSYFFTFSRMARYYSLASLLYIIAFYFFYRWIKNKSDFRKWVITSVILLNVDYPTYLLFVITSGCFFLEKKAKISLSESIKLGTTTFLGFLPVLYLFLVLAHQSSNQPWLFTSINIPKILLKIAMGFMMIPCHILFGEFFHPIISIGLGVGVIVLLVVLTQKIWCSNDRVLRDCGLFLLFNSLALALLLSTLVTRYPIFSFSRFLLPCAYAFFYLMVKLLDTSKGLLVGLLVINICVLGLNIEKKYFINPILFYPTDQVATLIHKYPQAQLLANTSKSDIQDPYSYFIRRNFPQRIQEPGQLDPTKSYFTVLDVRLESSVESQIQDLRNQYPAYTVNTVGFDNITRPNKLFMKRYFGVVCDYKYYACVLTKSK